MKRWAFIFAVGLVGICLIVDFVRDFIANEPIRYFAAQPLQLLWVAVIAVGGGLGAEVFCRLSPISQCKIKLIAAGLAASGWTILMGNMLYWIITVSIHLGVVHSFRWLIIGDIAWIIGVAALLWFLFYRIYKSRVR